MTFKEVNKFLHEYGFIQVTHCDVKRIASFMIPDYLTYLNIRISDEIGDDYVKQLANRFFAENSTRKTLIAMFNNNNIMVKEVEFTEDDDVYFSTSDLAKGGIKQYTLSESYPELHKKFHNDLIHSLSIRSLSIRTAEQVTKRLLENS